MSFTIAVAGKGGTGKTTFSGLLIDYLSQNADKPLLAVDADANANLHEVLGVTYDKCIADIREDTLKQLPDYANIPKNILVEHLLHQTLVESTKFDLLVMGRPEGKRCYCFVNNLLRKHIDVISKNYGFIVIDNEAGMEHISRMTTRDIDVLFILSDSTLRGLRSAVRTRELVKEMNLAVKEQILVINKVRADNQEFSIQQAKEFGFVNIVTLPLDPSITQLDEKGLPLIEIKDISPIKQTLEATISSITSFNPLLAKQTLSKNVGDIE